MSTLGETARISDEPERVQSVSYPQIRSLSGLYISNALTPTEATGETKVRTDYAVLFATHIIS